VGLPSAFFSFIAIKSIGKRKERRKILCLFKGKEKDSMPLLKKALVSVKADLVGGESAS